MKSILMRYGVPVVVAVTLMAYVVVPAADRLLSRWFRNDIELRARTLASAMEQPLADLVEQHRERALQTYLRHVTSNERLVALVLCSANGTLIQQTAETPRELSCRAGDPDKPNDGFALRTHAGLVEVSPFTFTAGRHPLRLLMVHDLSFIDRRRSIARNYVLAFAGVCVTVLSLLVAFLTWLMIRRWVRALVGDIQNLRLINGAVSAPASGKVLSTVREVLREMEVRQRLEIDFRENWTPEALRQVVREHLGSPEMFIVSNREPYIHNTGPSGPIVQMPASGMVTALEPIVRACSGTWVAHGSGSADREVVDRFDRVRVPPEDPSYALRRVWLTPEEEQGFYYGFSNEGLWPLCHLAYMRPEFRTEDWQQYVEVNQRFADVVAQEAGSRDPVILIQDYHFALLPQLLRTRLRRSLIALFWHIPWPNAETFGVCPWKRELLSHLLGADILGFHTRYHCQNFLDTVDRFVECQIDHEQFTVTLRGHVCHVGSYPISIEWPPRWLLDAPSVESARRAVRARYQIAPEVALGLGVERWDFTKGIVERFRALEHLLEHNHGYRGRVTMLQVAAPSRSKLPAYQALQQQTRQEVARINERFGSGTYRPIVLIDRHQEPAQVFELYRAADFCMVNSLHDGMNLVAKEFVAARDDEDGVLIMSTFTGASRELLEALLINPFDVNETAAAIKGAIEMPREERRIRMRLMRRTVKENNVYRWAGRMLMEAARIRQRQNLPGARIAPVPSVASLPVSAKR